MHELMKNLARLTMLPLALAGTLAGAQAPTPAPAIAPATTPAISLVDGYVLGPGDVLEISVLGRDEFKPRVQVQVDGTIQLPYLHSIKVQDLTVLQLRDQIARLLKDGGYYTDPVVAVTVVSYASRYVTLLGQFGNPGLLPVDRAYRVSEIIARAGGTKPTAAAELLIRHPDGSQSTLQLDAIASGGLEQDPMIQPGDKLYIAEAPMFYLYGQVGAPGAYQVGKDMTVRMALARAGGLTERGSTGRISVFRNGQKIKADLDTLVKGQDTILVGERFF